MLESPFPGREQLVEQTSTALVREVDDDRSLEFQTRGGEDAQVLERVPVEAHYIDADGKPVELLLHVVEGRLTELERWKSDGSPVREWPAPELLTVTVAASDGGGPRD